MEISSASFLILAAICTVISADSNAFCEERRSNDAACASYCYAVSKPLLQMAPVCHQKDQQIAELKEKLQALQQQAAQCKLHDELSSLRSAVEALAYSRPSTTIEQVNRRVASCVGSQRQLSGTRDELRKCLEMHTACLKGKASKTTAASPATPATAANPANCLNVSNSFNIRTVQVEGLPPFRVPCDGNTAGPGWMVIQQRQNDMVDFEQDWVTYRRGFGNLYGNFFIGLEKLHRLTSAQPHELYIELMEFSGLVTQAHYDNFRVDSEAEGYRLILLGDYLGGAGDAGDALSYNNYQKFSTYDRDNDASEQEHCAKTHLGGWWYKNCTQW